MNTIRIGHGYDVHAFTEGTFVMLGGVKVAFDRGLLAHSDGDLVLHALCDALLGAAALGDIGVHFPDTSEQWKDSASSVLLKEVLRKLALADYRVINVDVTLIAQVPRVSPYREMIRVNIAELMSLDEKQVNFKATTTERLGYIGREEGMAAHAVVLIEHLNQN